MRKGLTATTSVSTGAGCGRIGTVDAMQIQAYSGAEAISYSPLLKSSVGRRSGKLNSAIHMKKNAAIYASVFKAYI
jgi:hypothetical protein